jgi:hypothetical protein
MWAFGLFYAHGSHQQPRHAKAPLVLHWKLLIRW